MTAYASKRLLLVLPTAFFVSIAIFGMIRLIPGDPALARAGLEVDAASLAEIRREMGLDEPLPVQYALWLGDVARGEFGRSWRSNQPVSLLIAQKLPATLTLAVAAMALAVLVAFPVGVIAATRPGGKFDTITSSATLLAVAMPGFWLGILLIILFSLQLRWLPPSGYVPLTQDVVEGLRRVAMPATVLGLHLAAPLARFIRAGMLEALSQDYVRTARAKGLGQRVVLWRHALRNSMLPVLTVIGLQISGLIGGAIIVESLFSYPGLGVLLLAGIQQRDYGVVQGVVVFIAVSIMLITLAIDLAYGLLDPRIRQQ